MFGTPRMNASLRRHGNASPLFSQAKRQLYVYAGRCIIRMQWCPVRIRNQNLCYYLLQAPSLAVSRDGANHWNDNCSRKSPCLRSAKLYGRQRHVVASMESDNSISQTVLLVFIRCFYVFCPFILTPFFLFYTSNRGGFSTSTSDSRGHTGVSERGPVTRKKICRSYENSVNVSKLLFHAACTSTEKPPQKNQFCAWTRNISERPQCEEWNLAIQTRTTGGQDGTGRGEAAVQ